MSYEAIGLAILDYLNAHRHIGRDRAIPRKTIEDDLGVFVPYKDLDRAFRMAYERLPICSSAQGLFIPDVPPAGVIEVREFREYLMKKVGPIIAHRRVSVIYAARPELVPEFGNQMELF